MNFSGKTALLTGASRGIGHYIARRLAKEGIIIAGVARSESDLNTLKQNMETHGHPCKVFPFDLTQTHKLKKLINHVESTMGPIHFLINNAGIEHYEYFHRESYSTFDGMIKTNLMAPLELSRILLPKMLDRNEGHIINIASLAGKKGVAYNSIYSATKAGMIMWVDGLRQELKEKNVHISAICPGFISDAGMFHDGQIDPPKLLGSSKPEKVGEAIITALQSGSSELIVNHGPIRPLLALGQLFPKFGDAVVRWFGVPALSKKRINS